MHSDLLTAAEAAAALGLSSSRVRALVASGALPATKRAGALWINAADLALVRDRGKAGWPKGTPRHPHLDSRPAS